jgi:hypothetical protein
MKIDPSSIAQRQRRAEWIEKNGLKLVERGRCCGHILRKRTCPASTRYGQCYQADSTFCDHWQVWQRPNGTRFGLAHTYARLEDALPRAREWASHRLTVVSDPEDAWYGFGTDPIRYTPHSVMDSPMVWQEAKELAIEWRNIRAADMEDHEARTNWWRAKATAICMTCQGTGSAAGKCCPGCCFGCLLGKLG